MSNCTCPLPSLPSSETHPLCNLTWKACFSPSRVGVTYGSLSERNKHPINSDGIWTGKKCIEKQKTLSETKPPDKRQWKNILRRSPISRRKKIGKKNDQAIHNLDHSGNHSRKFQENSPMHLGRVPSQRISIVFHCI